MYVWSQDTWQTCHVLSTKNDDFKYSTGWRRFVVLASLSQSSHMYYGLCVSVLMRDNTLSLLLCISCAFTRWRHLDDSLSVSCQQTPITSLLTVVRVARSNAAAAGIYWYICTLTDWLTVVYSWTPCNLLYNCCQTATSWCSLPLHHWENGRERKGGVQLNTTTVLSSPLSALPAVGPSILISCHLAHISVS